MPAILSGTLSTARSDLRAVEGLPLPLDIRIHPAARRITLRLDERRQCLRLTRPRSVSERKAVAWALGQGEWVRAQLETRGGSIALEPGAIIPFDGQDHRLISDPASPRRPVLGDGEIRVGGPLDGFASRVARWLKIEAKLRLDAETRALAEPAGITITAVQVGDASTRWGSCSRDGRIRYSWRLILAPPEVRRYVVAHEVAHRLHMDHGPAFKAAERELLGRDPAPLRRELKRLSAGLRRVRLP